MKNKCNFKLENKNELQNWGTYCTTLKCKFDVNHVKFCAVGEALTLCKAPPLKICKSAIFANPFRFRGVLFLLVVLTYS